MLESLCRDNSSDGGGFDAFCSVFARRDSRDRTLKLWANKR